jgi:hypothetical protein
MSLVLVYTPTEIVVCFMAKLVEEDPGLQGVLRSPLQFLVTYSYCNTVTGDCRQGAQNPRRGSVSWNGREIFGGDPSLVCMI